MKSFMLILTSIFVLTACSVPSPSDFESDKKPLSEDEFLVIWRFTRVAKDWEVLDKSPEHKTQLEEAMVPLFQQLIPQIFSDLRKGKLKIRLQEDITELNEELVQDLPSKMKKLFEGSWQNLSPYMETFHITQRRNVFTAGFPAIELELELIAQDPEGRLPEKRLGAVSVDDLKELGYDIQFEGQKYDLIAYLDKIKKYSYPIAYFYQGHENGLRTLEAAFGTKKLLLEGKWASIDWVAAMPNLTGMKLVQTPISIMNQFEGEYFFQSNQGSLLTQLGSKEPIVANVSVSENSSNTPPHHFFHNENYLIVNWSINGHSFLVFPTNDQAFFTINGDRISFSQLEDGRLMMTVIEKNGSKSIGFR